MPKNPLHAAIEGYDRMVADLAEAKKQIAIYADHLNRIGAENEMLRQQLENQKSFYLGEIDAATETRDRIAAALNTIMTRFNVIEECFTKCREDAIAEGLKINAPAKKEEAAAEIDEALEAMGLDDPARKPQLPTFVLPVNRMKL